MLLVLLWWWLLTICTASFACQRGNHVGCDDSSCDCGCHEHPSRGGGR